MDFHSQTKGVQLRAPLAAYQAAQCAGVAGLQHISSSHLQQRRPPLHLGMGSFHGTALSSGSPVLAKSFPSANLV